MHHLQDMDVTPKVGAPKPH